MSKIIEAVAADIEAVERDHPALYGVLSELAEAFAGAEIDPDSALATPASALVAAFRANGGVA